MAATKIQNEQEVIDWITSGRTYAWMVAEYKRKYHIETSVAMFSNFRRRHGLAGRVVRDPDLIPWTIKEEHRYAYPVMNLRYEARRRAGEPVPELALKRVEGWLRNLAAMCEGGAVVHYDPETKEGWHYVPRRPGIDNDIIREPGHEDD